MAYNSMGDSSASNQASATTQSLQGPGAPTTNAATNVTSSGFTANWTSVSGATGYRLDVSTDSVYSTYVSGYQALDVGNVLSQSVSGLSASTTYYYRLRAYNANGTSSYSNTTGVITAAAAAPPTWSKAVGSTGDDRVLAMAVDNSANIITTGYYTGTVDFAGYSGNSSSIHTSTPYNGVYYQDIFLAKYDSAGNHLWSKSFGNDGKSEVGQALAVDASGNIYLAGKTATGNTLRYIDFGCTNNDFQGAGPNAFVVKLNGQGQCQWVRYVSDNYADVGTGVTVDAAGSVYMTGSFEGPANFDGQDPVFGSATFRRIGIGTLAPYTGPSASDGYIVKYNSSGAVQWVRQFGGASVDQGNNVSLDRTDNGVVVTGTFYGSASFEDSDGALKLPIASTGDKDALMVKYSSTGQLLWAIPVGTAGPDFLSANAVDGSGNVWVTGLLNGQLYVAKYLGSNRQLAWPAKYFASGNVSNGNSISLDASGTATIGGYLNAALDFGGGLLTPQQADTFAVQYNTSGTYVAGSGKLYGGGGYQMGVVVVNGSGERVLAGYFPDFATFGSSAYSSAGANDIFICKP
jgi:hypothetical protein